MKHVQGLCYELTDVPLRGFAFQLFGTSVPDLARYMYSMENKYFVNYELFHIFFHGI